MRLRAATVMAAVAALVAIAAPPALASRGACPARAQPAQAQLSAQIRYTTGGVPHILAHSWPGLGFAHTQPRWRCRESRSRLAHGCAVSQAGGESPGALPVLRAAARQMAIYQRILPVGSGQDRIT